MRSGGFTTQRALLLLFAVGVALGSAGLVNRESSGGLTIGDLGPTSTTIDAAKRPDQAGLRGAERLRKNDKKTLKVDVERKPKRSRKNSTTTSTDTAGTDTAGADTEDTETTGADTAGTETTSTDTTSTDTAGTETTSADTAGTDTAGTDTGEASTSGTSTDGSDGTTSDSDQSGTDNPTTTSATTGSTGDTGPTSETTTSAPQTTVVGSSSTTTTSGSTSGGSSTLGQPTAPIRAAFMYPWFPNAWRQGGIEPFTNFTPSLGRYASDDVSIIHKQIELASNAHIDAFIASWWGQGHHTDQALPVILDATVAATSPNRGMKWAIYYEPEGQGDPSPSTIAADLRYLRSNYFGHDAFLEVNGDPVVFVWAESSDGADMSRRWAEAEQLLGHDVFVVLKVYSGYRTSANQPDSWHQYGPAKAYHEHLPHSATVSPGFWLVGENPRLSRDLNRFRNDVSTMNQSGAFWHLITSWNEWGEGTAVEPAIEFGMDYLDALAANRPTRSGG